MLRQRRHVPCGRAQDGSTPLHLAANNGRLECAQLLLDRGGDKDAKNNVRAQAQLPRSAACGLLKFAHDEAILRCPSFHVLTLAHSRALAVTAHHSAHVAAGRKDAAGVDRGQKLR